MTKLAVIGGGAAVGLAAGYMAMSGTKNDPSARSTATFAALGGGVAAAGLGALLAKGTFERFGAMGSILNHAGVGVMALGAGAIVGSLAGMAFNHLPHVDLPTPGPGNPNPGWPTDPGTTTPTPTPTPTTPAPVDAGSVGDTVGGIAGGDGISGGLTAHDKVLVAAAAVQSGTSAQQANAFLDKLSADEYVPTVLGGHDQALLAAAGMVNGRTPEQVVTAFVNVDAAQDTAGQPVTGDIDDPKLRVKLAVAALNGQQTTGTDAAYAYGAISNQLQDDLSVAQRVELAAATIEGGALGDETVNMYRQVARGNFPGVSGADKVDVAVKMTAAAIRGNATAQQAIDSFRQVATDKYISTAQFTTSQIADLAAGALQRGYTGTDGANALVNVAADETAYNDAAAWDEVIAVALDGLQAQKTGAETAHEYDQLSAQPGVRDALDAVSRFQLTGAALVGGATGRQAGTTFHDLSSGAATASLSHAQDGLLTAAAMHGLDVSADSDLVRWYDASDN